MEMPILGDPGATSRDEAIFSGESLLQELKGFSSSIDMLGSYSGKIVVESFRKKDSTKPMKS